MYQNDNNLRYNNNNNQNNKIQSDNINNNNDLNPNFNRTSPNINNNNMNQNNNRTSMSQVGEKLIYNNTFNNNVVNKEVYKHPSTGFKNIILYRQQKYSKNLINILLYYY